MSEVSLLDHIKQIIRDERELTDEKFKAVHRERVEAKEALDAKLATAEFVQQMHDEKANNLQKLMNEERHTYLTGSNFQVFREQYNKDIHALREEIHTIDGKQIKLMAWLSAAWAAFTILLNLWMKK